MLLFITTLKFIFVATLTTRRTPILAISRNATVTLLRLHFVEAKTFTSLKYLVLFSVHYQIMNKSEIVKYCQNLSKKELFGLFKEATSKQDEVTNQKKSKSEMHLDAGIRKFQEAFVNQEVAFNVWNLFKKSVSKQTMNKTCREVLKSTSIVATVVLKREDYLVLELVFCKLLFLISKAGFYASCVWSVEQSPKTLYDAVKMKAFRDSSNPVVKQKYKILIKQLTESSKCIESLEQHNLPAPKQVFSSASTSYPIKSAVGHRREAETSDAAVGRVGNYSLQWYPRFVNCNVGDSGVFRLRGLYTYDKTKLLSDTQQNVLKQYSVEVTIMQKDKTGVVVRVVHFDTLVHVTPTLLQDNYNSKSEATLLSASTLRSLQATTAPTDNNVYNTIAALVADRIHTKRLHYKNSVYASDASSDNFIDREADGSDCDSDTDNVPKHVTTKHRTRQSVLQKKRMCYISEESSSSGDDEHKNKNKHNNKQGNKCSAVGSGRHWAEGRRVKVPTDRVCSESESDVDSNTPSCTSETSAVVSSGASSHDVNNDNNSSADGSADESDESAGVFRPSKSDKRAANRQRYINIGRNSTRSSYSAAKALLQRVKQQSAAEYHNKRNVSNSNNATTNNRVGNVRNRSESQNHNQSRAAVSVGQGASCSNSDKDSDLSSVVVTKRRKRESTAGDY